MFLESLSMYYSLNIKGEVAIVWKICILPGTFVIIIINLFRESPLGLMSFSSCYVTSFEMAWHDVPLSLHIVVNVYLD